MEFNFIHVLVLTPFESSLTSLQWDEVIAQDFTVHLLYCRTNGRVILHSNNQKFDCTERISQFYEMLVKSGIPFTDEQQIIILRDNESEYNAEDILKHLN
jgi:hypothetical protein